jgi:hypothetical protein
MAITTDTLKATNLRSSSSPASKAFTITPSDANYLSETQAGLERQIHTRGIMVGTDGNLNVIFAMDDDAVVIGVKAGVLYPFSIKKVLNTSHTAGTVWGFR